MKTRCAKCGGTTRHELAAHALAVSGVKLIGEVGQDACTKCDGATVSLAELGRFELLAAVALARHGVCTGEAFKFIRKALGMRAADVGAVLGVAPETVSRWETGERDADRHAFAMLGELAIRREERRRLLRTARAGKGGEPREAPPRRQGRCA